MRRDDHCKLTRQELGRPFVDVHKWMDAFMPTLGPAHRKVRHHYQGILSCADELKQRREYRYEALWADLAKAAALHVAQDMIKDGKQFPIPRREDYEYETNEGNVISDGFWPQVEPWSEPPKKPNFTQHAP